LEIQQDAATELNKEAFLPVTEETFPPQLSGLEEISPLQMVNRITFFPITVVF
jgi:hypothetical protein